MSDRLPMCIQWKDKRGAPQWCVAPYKLDPEAFEDRTLCRKVVLLRTGSEHRMPTCPDCLERMRNG